MPDKCSVCGEDFNVEPGYYTGALWISYPIVIIILIPFSILQILLLNISFIVAFFISLSSLLILQPFIMRFSRAIWINLFVHYENRIN
jgi:uncharacterized protein (DUF983 family)